MATKLIHGWHLPDTEVYFDKILPLYPAESDGRRIYQFNHLDRCFNYLAERPRRIAIDIGAHVGFWTYYLTKSFIHVHSFEPLKRHIECFKKNIAADNVTLHSYGLSNKKENRLLIYDDKNSGGTFVDPKKIGDTAFVRLDDFKFSEIDFIKIDVEGYEEFILQGAEETLIRNKPIIIIEQKESSIKYNIERYEAVKFLEKLGASIFERVKDDFIMGWQ